jgi:hypothetical protein
MTASEISNAINSVDISLPSFFIPANVGQYPYSKAFDVQKTQCSKPYLQPFLRPSHQTRIAKYRKQANRHDMENGSNMF